MISFVVWYTMHIIFTLTDFIIQFIYRTKCHDIIHAVVHIDWTTFASLECERVLIMFWETCIFTNLFAMIIHLYYDIHHLKKGVCFGSVLENIVYSRQVYIEVGVWRASLAQFSMFFVRDSVWRLVAKTFVRLFACNLELLTVWGNSQCDQPQPVELLAS